MEFSTPSYRLLQQRQEEELRKLENNNIDVFVNVVNAARKEPATVQLPVSIGWKPEAVEKVRRAEKKKVEDSYDQGFVGGLLFAGALVIMAVVLLVM